MNRTTALPEMERLGVESAAVCLGHCQAKHSPEGFRLPVVQQARTLAATAAAAEEEQLKAEDADVEAAATAASGAHQPATPLYDDHGSR